MPARSTTCPTCSRPAARVTEAALVWCVGVTTSRAFHHDDGRICIPPGRWCSRGEEPCDAA